MKHYFMMNHTKKHHDFEKYIHQIMQGYDYEVIYTNSIKDSQKFISKCQTVSRFYAVGGDGTLHGIMQMIVHTPHELVLVPLGTGNDFCRTLTNEKSPYKLLKQSLQLKTQKVDTIQLNDFYYINSACFGVDSVIANHVHDTPDIPFVPESKSYVVSILQNVFQYGFDNITVTSGKQCLYKGRITLCTVNNGKYYGGGFCITPQASIQDGYMDLCIAEKVPKYKIPYLLTYLLSHQLHKRKEVHMFKLKEATIICEQSCNVDGEEIKQKAYHFKICPASLNMVIF